MDEFFVEFGPKHRFKRHHRQGVREAQHLFGELGRLAATIHILRDCRHIPRESDYAEGVVDDLGLVAKWPVSAYIQYSDDAFERLAMFVMHGPEAVLNLGSFRSLEDVNQILATTKLPSEPTRFEAVSRRWTEAAGARDRLPPLREADIRPLTVEQRSYAQELEPHPLMQSIRQQFPEVSIQLASPASLVNPLVWVDLEYVEQLRAELIAVDDRGAIRFAVPTLVNVSTQVSIDADGRGVSMVSAQKQLAALPPIVGQLPGLGMHVTFNVVGTPQFILASRVDGRLYLRNGMHRAYLLAAAGIEYIPTVIVDERVLSPVTTVYPSFNLPILQQDRPPLLGDMLNDELTVRIPILRTQKVVRLRVEELLLPVD
jgi:hypothetical protein